MVAQLPQGKCASDSARVSAVERVSANGAFISLHWNAADAGGDAA